MDCKLRYNTTQPAILNQYFDDKNIILFNSGNAYIYVCDYGHGSGSAEPKPTIEVSDVTEKGNAYRNKPISWKMTLLIHFYLIQYLMNILFLEVL